MGKGKLNQAALAESSGRGLRLRISAEPSYVARLAAVYADPIRAKIVAELYMREMSPTQFFEDFGGGSPARVRRHFKELAEHGWLRKVRTDNRGATGRPQHLYRSTELPVIDDETWAEFPLSVRGWFSWRTLVQVRERVRESMAAGTLRDRPDRHLSCTQVVLDERGWQEQISRMNDCFRALAQEQADAKIRLQEVGGESTVAVVALGGFESPQRPTAAPDSGGAAPAGLPRQYLDVPFSLRVAKVFADPLMLKIITELDRRPMSATQLAEKIGEASVYGFDRRCKILLELGWLEHVGTKTGGKRRGATEHFYRAAGPDIDQGDVLRGIPLSKKSRRSHEVVEEIFEAAREALTAGTFDARTERHLSWSPMRLDELGWRQVIAMLDGFVEATQSAQEEAEQRLRCNRATPIRATSFLAGFEAAHSRDTLWVL